MSRPPRRSRFWSQTALHSGHPRLRAGIRRPGASWARTCWKRRRPQTPIRHYARIATSWSCPCEPTRSISSGSCDGGGRGCPAPLAAGRTASRFLAAPGTWHPELRGAPTEHWVIHNGRGASWRLPVQSLYRETARIAGCGATQLRVPGPGRPGRCAAAGPGVPRSGWPSACRCRQVRAQPVKQY
jgi:hypothetical protein